MASIDLLQQLAYRQNRIDPPRLDRTGKEIESVRVRIVCNTHGYVIGGHASPLDPGEHDLEVYEDQMPALMADVENYLRDDELTLPKQDQIEAARANQRAIESRAKRAVEAFESKKFTGTIDSTELASYARTFRELMDRDLRPLRSVERINLKK